MTLIRYLTGFSLIEIFLGLRVLRLRVLELFNIMFELDLRHNAATLLHPCYRRLKGCSTVERDQVYNYVREEMKKIVFDSKQQGLAIVANKKPKFLLSILQEYEDDGNVIDNSKVGDGSSGSEEFGYNVLQQPDELARYLSMEFDKSTLSLNPLQFWEQYQRVFPVLSIVAGKIHCIPAFSAAVERCFSSTWFMINDLYIPIKSII